ncbi:hypothetical protein BOTBODRAFT_161411 [Botryobasidium botryosum FD-172 SS1]|uniref:NAD(P)-binding domain-containing protein n=1 Tax=Botryobasidium botryosum (strain FD-172 SS1) TaxID=930990 RepID=A0A067MLU9_BOTB1|nr:hypothetical protein BOTBODRAFT_161411 [Botryobasidium botryosum FD-172 SS1]
MAATPAASALIVGATGATGRHVLTELLASNHFTRVVEVGRRVTPPESLADAAGKDKLVQKVIDFENTQVAEWKLKDQDADVVFITLGTTRAAAGSQERWDKIDREIPLNVANDARIPGKDQRVVYLSSTGANAGSMFSYPRSKGLTEQGLAKAGYTDAIMFRPGLLKTKRDEPRLLESLYGKLTGVLSTFHGGLEIPVTTLAKSIVHAGSVGTAGLSPAAAASTQPAEKDVPAYTIIGNKGAADMAKSL